MGITLQKGQRISLDKVAPGLEKIFIGLGWDVRATDGSNDFDLDAAAFMLGANEKLPKDDFFIFYNNLKSPCGSVQHTGDNLTGDGEGDDEVIKLDLTKIPANIQKIVITVTIHEAVQRGQNFGQVTNAFVRLVNDSTGAEVLRYDLTEDYSTETCLIMAELYRKDGEWRFNPVAAGYKDGLQALVNRYAN